MTLCLIHLVSLRLCSHLHTHCGGATRGLSATPGQHAGANVALWDGRTLCHWSYLSLCKQSFLLMTCDGKMVDEHSDLQVSLAGSILMRAASLGAGAALAAADPFLSDGAHWPSRSVFPAHVRLLRDASALQMSVMQRDADSTASALHKAIQNFQVS